MYAGYTICTSIEHIVYGAFCGSTPHMLSHYVQLHARLFGSMRALLLPLCALGHNNGSHVCASSKCTGETVHLSRLFWVVDARI